MKKDTVSSMPEQVWRAENCSIFNNEIEAICYEESDKLFRNFYDAKGERKTEPPKMSELDFDFRSVISERLLQMFVKEFAYLPVAVSETDGFNELSNRLHGLKGSTWLYPDD